MKIIYAANELEPSQRSVCLAIGFFDGVHLGHQQIIRQAIADARTHGATALVITFDQHPNTIVAPDRVPPLLQSLRQRLRCLEAIGPDALQLTHFDEGFSRKTGERFIREIARDFGTIHSICVGSDFHFGFKRSGNVALLQRMSEEFKFTVHGLPAEAFEGQPISSTRIREAVRTGNLAAASQMLARAYSFAGMVVRGDGLGRRLGFPTANLETTGLVLPPNGVYAVHARCGENSHRGVMNIGLRPTLLNPVPRLRVEVHLLEFTGDVHSQELEVTPVARLREEQKFPSTDQLKAQIARDISAAKREFSGSGTVGSP